VVAIGATSHKRSSNRHGLIGQPTTGPQSVPIATSIFRKSWVRRRSQAAVIRPHRTESGPALGRAWEGRPPMKKPTTQRWAV